MRVSIYIVEAVDYAGRTLWRNVFDSEAAAQRCYADAKASGLKVHKWEM